MLVCIFLNVGYGQESYDSISTRELEELVIYSVRANESTPTTSKTVTREEIEEFYIGQDPSVVIEQLTPSIISYSDAGSPIGNYNQFRLRGIDQTRINMTLNGVPLNDMIDQGVFFSNFSDFTNSVESFQVQRGVGTSSNGVASYGGSVNFESYRLNQPDPSLELQLLYGSFNTLRTSVEASTGKLENNVGAYARFTRTSSDGYKRYSGSDSYSFFASGGYLGDKDVIKVTAFAGKTQNDQSYLPVLLSDIKSDPFTNYNHPNDTDDFEQELIQLQYSRIISDDITINSTAYFGGARGEFPFGLDDTTQLIFGLENEHLGFFGDMLYEKGSLDLALGVHVYNFQRANINSLAPSIVPTYTDETFKNEFSSFVKANYSVGNRTNIFADIQARFVDLKFEGASLQTLAGIGSVSRSWTFINPKIGINTGFGTNSNLYISLGRTGREPTRTDILQGDGSGIYDYNITSLLDETIVREEYVNDLEIGYRFKGKNLDLDVNYFFMSFEDEISPVGALAARSYIPLRVNVEKSLRTGVEVVSHYRVNEVLSLVLNGSYLMTNINEFTNSNSELIQDVEHIFSPNLMINPSLSLDVNKFGLNLFGRYVSESFMELSNDQEFTLPSFFVLDGNLKYDFSDSFSMSITVNNILDETYFTEGSPVDIDFDGNVEGPGYRIQPPRNIFISGSFRF